MWHRDQYRRNPYGGSIYPASTRYATTSSSASLTNDSTAIGNSAPKGQSRLRVAAIVYGVLGLLAVFSNFELLPTGATAFARQLHRLLTTNGVLCISNIYATPEEAVSMPEVPSMDDQCKYEDMVTWEQRSTNKTRASNCLFFGYRSR